MNNNFFKSYQVLLISIISYTTGGNSKLTKRGFKVFEKNSGFSFETLFDLRYQFNEIKASSKRINSPQLLGGFSLPKRFSIFFYRPFLNHNYISPKFSDLRSILHLLISVEHRNSLYQSVFFI